MIKKLSLVLLGCLIFVSLPLKAEEGKYPKYPVNLYFFWGKTCPHCATAKPFLERLKEKYPLLTVKDYEVYDNEKNRTLFSDMSEAFETQASGVPSFFIGEEKPLIGFSEMVGITLEQNIIKCVVDGCPDAMSKMATFKANPIKFEKEEKKENFEGDSLSSTASPLNFDKNSDQSSESKKK